MKVFPLYLERNGADGPDRIPHLGRFCYIEENIVKQVFHHPNLILNSDENELFFNTVGRALKDYLDD